MSNKKGFLGTGTLLLGASLLAGFIIYKKSVGSKDLPQGSLGGTDELLGQQGFDIDPNAIPDQPQNDPVYYIIAPDGAVIPQSTEGAGTDGGVGIPSNVPIASTGTGTLFQDTAAVGGSIGANLMLPSIAKRINSLVDTKYVSDKLAKQSDSAFSKFVKDPYGVNDLVATKSEKAGTREIVELGVTNSGQSVLKTVPNWAKGIKTVANFIPLADVPIGAGLDVYFSKYEQDPSKKIDWGTAIKANVAGELAQLGVAGAGTLAGTVVPVAGNLAGGVTGFVAGTSADIATTELYYKSAGKTSLFSGDTTIQKPAYENLTPAQKTASNNLATAIGANMTSPLTTLQNIKSSSGSSSKSSNVNAVSKATTAPTNNITKAVSSTPSTTVSKSATTSSSATAAKTVTVTPKVSVISQVVQAPIKVVQSVVNKFKSVTTKKK